MGGGIVVPAGDFAAFLVSLGAAGVEVSAHPRDQGGVRFRGQGLTAAMRDGIRAHRGLLRLLLDGPLPAGSEAGYVLEERLGVAMGLGMPVHPGAPAWLIAVGEALAVAEPSVPSLEVTAEHLAAWDVAAGGHQGASLQAARVFIQEAWRRVNRLEVMGGMTRADAISAVLAAMDARTHTPTGDPSAGGIVNCHGEKVGGRGADVCGARATLRRTGGRGAAA